MLKKIIFISLVFFSCANQKLPLAKKKDFTINYQNLNEISGIVKSRKFKDLFWAHNDSDCPPCVFPIDSKGHFVKDDPSIKDNNYFGYYINGANNIDWEDICYDGDSNLVIGDFGNNKNKRKNLALYAFKEPNPYQDQVAKLAYKISFKYEDQKNFPPKSYFSKNFDCEALFYYKENFYLLTKNWGNFQTNIYILPAKKNTKNQIAKKILTFNIRGLVTAVDIDEDEIVVLTYNSINSFQLVTENSKIKDLKLSQTIPLDLAYFGQIEAICYTKKDQVLVTNEQGSCYLIDL